MKDTISTRSISTIIPSVSAPVLVHQFGLRNRNLSDNDMSKDQKHTNVFDYAISETFIHAETGSLSVSSFVTVNQSVRSILNVSEIVDMS